MARDNNESRWAEVIFMQGDEGREVVDRIERLEGVVMRGPTDSTVSEAIEHLAQWDMGEYHETFTWDELMGRTGAQDKAVQPGGGDYVLTWHAGLGYVGLAVRVED